MNIKKLYLILLTAVVVTNLSAQLASISNNDTLCGHPVMRDNQQRILGWYKPEIPGAVYDKVVHLASEFMRNIPAESTTGLPMYLVTCCFEGPQFTQSEKIVAVDWPHNPACVYAGSVQSLAIRYRVYTGDDSWLKIVREMLDYQIDNGTTLSEWKWPDVPFASADPFSKVYLGATRWEGEGMRGDGLHVIEPDKIGELGYAYLLFYEITGDPKYLQASINCADALSANIREVSNDSSPFSLVHKGESPWPFRVNARTGTVISEYCSNVLEPVKLFDELIRIQKQINLNEERAAAYRKASGKAWEWMYSKAGPMTTFIWNGYFEDIPNDPEMSNRLQITPVEVAKYLLLHPEKDKYLKTNVPSLIHWVANAFKTEGLDAIKEQTWCYEPMGSHTSRYGAACAMFYEYSGDEWYRDQAYRFLNVASYMTYENGVVAVGPNWPGSWFSDGYGDYIRHFIDAMAAVPEWAPAGENHLLRSSSVVKDINYKPGDISFTTFDSESSVVLRLSSKPKSISLGGKKLALMKSIADNGWTWVPLDKGGICRLKYSGGNAVAVSMK